MRKDRGMLAKARRRSKPAWFALIDKLHEAVASGNAETAEHYAIQAARTAPGKRANRFTVPRIKRELGL